MISGIRHIGLVVRDIDIAIDFWCNAMGFLFSEKMDEKGSHLDAMMGLEDVNVVTAKLKAPDGNLLELLQFKSHPDKDSWSGKAYSTGLTHIALTVEDIETVYERLKQFGVSFPSRTSIFQTGK